MSIDLVFKSNHVVVLLALFQHIRVVLTVWYVIVYLKTTAEVLNLHLAWVLVLLGVLLGLLGDLLLVAVRWSTHQTSHCLMCHFRASSEGHTGHDCASNTAQESPWLLWNLLGRDLGVCLLILHGSWSSLCASWWWWSGTSSWSSSCHLSFLKKLIKIIRIK